MWEWSELYNKKRNLTIWQEIVPQELITKSNFYSTFLLRGKYISLITTEMLKYLDKLWFAFQLNITGRPHLHLVHLELRTKLQDPQRE